MTSKSVGDINKVYQFHEDITKIRRRLLRMLNDEQTRDAAMDRKRSTRVENLMERLNKLTLGRQDELMRVYSNVNLSRNIAPLARRPPRKLQKLSQSLQRQPDTVPLQRQSPLPLPSPSKSKTPSPLPSISKSMTSSPLPSIPKSTTSSPLPSVPKSTTSSPLPSIPKSTTSSPLPSSSKSVTPAQTPSPTAPLKVAYIVVKSDKIDIDMTPVAFKSDGETGKEQDDKKEENEEDDDIIYPEGITDYRPYKTIARYRQSIGKSTNFREYPLLIDEDSTETLILGLENFAQQHGCDLSYTNENQQFDKSIYHAACGLADLGSIHLLATDSLLTANFQFEIDLDQDNIILSSKESIEEFVLDFCDAVSKVLSCDNNNVRVFSIDKVSESSEQNYVNFGLTTTNQERTEELAHTLQTYARTGFETETILRRVKPGEYEYTWKPVLTRLQIGHNDLDPRYNFDYRKAGIVNQDTRGSCPYYLPIGWFRHGLNVSTKYGDDKTWIGQANIEGEWPVAFHGTKRDAVSGITKDGLLISTVKTDVKKQEAIEQIGEEANRPGLYVATHCNGGSDIYTTPFEVNIFPDKSERFRIVFQCRVQPDKFTIHTSPVNIGEAWRIVDPNAIRPYGILLKKEN